MDVNSFETLTQSYLAADPKQIMAQHGKSFYFASMIFNKERLFKIATLYKLCRYIDDCADELSVAESKKAITAIISELDQSGNVPDLTKLIHEVNTWGVESSYIKELVIGAEFDAKGGEVDSLKDLLVYCYRVAGVVGLMMCPLIGVKDKRAYPYAIDLGLGMQLTNICRDILEDAKMGRTYIPSEYLDQANLGIETIKQQGQTPLELKDIVSLLLSKADEYYKSAYTGLCFIPFRPRVVILLAGEIYRHIGVKIRKNSHNVLAGRTYLNTGEKILVSLKTLRFLFSSKFWNTKSHSSQLHYLIKELPGTHQ